MNRGTWSKILIMSTNENMNMTKNRLSRAVKLKGRSVVILCLGWLALFTGNVFANEHSATTSTARESYQIGKSGLNRITMLPHKIVSVAGDSSEYKLQSDADGSSIFVMPLADIGKDIELSLRSDIGEIRDLNLKVVSGRGRTIKLHNASKLDLAALEKQEVQNMISAMQKKVRGGYRVRKHKRLIKNEHNLNIIQKASYSYKDLSGAVLLVRPLKSSRKKDLKASDVNHLMFNNLFKGTLAVSIEDNVSDKGVMVFVVTKNNNKSR